MTKVVLPPTPLASNLISTLLLHISARFDRDLDIRREEGGALAIYVDAEPSELAKMVVVALRGRELRPERVSGALPLIPGTGPGTDGRTISELLQSIGISRPSLRADRRVEIYDSLVRFLDRNRDDLANSIASMKISVVRGVLEIALGRAKHLVPTIIKSEAFYEIGKFSGISDRKKGRPDIGRVDYRASPSIAALLYALLLALQTGYEAGVTEAYMFTVLQLEPGKISGLQAKLVNEVYLGLLEEVKRIALRMWVQDYEGLRLASILRLIEVYTRLKREFTVEPPNNVLFNHVVIGATGRRFFPLWTVAISVSELGTVTRTVEHFARELQIDVERAVRLLRMLAIAALKIVARSTASSARELWQGIRMLIYSFIEGRRFELLDNAYRMMRFLNDARTGLRAELVGTITSTAEDLGIEIDSLVLEPSEDRRIALWRSLKKLVNIIAF